jgi:hypothetical protein
VNEVPPPADFNPNVLHDWSVSHAGDEEMCYYDFRGMREVPEKKLLSEHQLDKLFELTAVIGMIILALWLMVRCF